MLVIDGRDLCREFVRCGLTGGNQRRSTRRWNIGHRSRRSADFDGHHSRIRTARGCCEKSAKSWRRAGGEVVAVALPGDFVAVVQVWWRQIRNENSQATVSRVPRWVVGRRPECTKPCDEDVDVALSSLRGGRGGSGMFGRWGGVSHDEEATLKLGG